MNNYLLSYFNKDNKKENNQYTYSVKKSTKNVNIRENLLSKNFNPNKHYEILNKYSKQQNKRVFGDSSKISFLSSNIDYTTIINNNQTLIDLQNLTKDDESFLRAMADSSNETFLKYCDMIIALINDYKEIIKLI